MAWEGCHQAPSSERAAAPAPHRFCSPPLEGLEPEASSTRVHAAPARPTPRSAGRTDPLGQPGCLTFAPFPCAAGSLPTLVARAAGSQCASPHGWPGDDPTVRRPRRLCDFARFGNGLTLPRLPRPSLFSDRHASLSGASWPFFPAFPPFLSSSPLLALHSSVSATSHVWGFPFCTVFVHQVRN
jgi:hypothetical protein